MSPTSTEKAPARPDPAKRDHVAHRHVRRLAVNASWLLRLRWVAVTGQLLTVGIAYAVLPDRIQLLPLLSIIGFTALTNVLLTISTRRLRVHEQADRGTEPQLAAVMLLDLFLLTALLMFSGGPFNPFALFYLVNLALAAVLLPRQWSWPLGVIGVVCFSILLFWYEAIPELERAPVPIASGFESLSTHHQIGFFLGLIMCAVMIVYFVTRVTSELQLREEELRVAELDRVRAERLEGLATLAAGAGHELASPLSTIAVVAKELERHLEGTDAPQAVLDDIELIRTELARCRTILNRMSTDAGQVAGDELKHLELGEVIDEVLRGLPYRAQVQLELTSEDRAALVFAPLHGLAQALRAVTQNAYDASSPNDPIVVAARPAGDWVTIEVRDQGEGMSPEVMARAGEPFFTTKEPGQGTGLGLFLTRSVIERLGGHLELSSPTSRGTLVRIITLIVGAVTIAIPELSAVREELLTLLISMGLALIGGYTMEDAAREARTRNPDLDDAELKRIVREVFDGLDELDIQ